MTYPRITCHSPKNPLSYRLTPICICLQESSLCQQPFPTEALAVTTFQRIQCCWSPHERIPPKVHSSTKPFQSVLQDHTHLGHFLSAAVLNMQTDKTSCLKSQQGFKLASQAIVSQVNNIDNTPCNRFSLSISYFANIVGSWHLTQSRLTLFSLSGDHQESMTVVYSHSLNFIHQTHHQSTIPPVSIPARTLCYSQIFIQYSSSPFSSTHFKQVCVLARLTNSCFPSCKSP